MNLNMGSMGWTLLCILGTLSCFDPSFGRRQDSMEMLTRLSKAFEKQAENLTAEMFTAHEFPKVGYEFSCPPSVSPTVPKSVHLLRPGDIKVVGAMGDSLTVAYAAGAKYFMPVMFEYPGMAASIGGDHTLNDIITIPNIFRKYNTHLCGFSTGLSVIYMSPPNKKLNVAIGGSYAEDMADQARELIAKMKRDPTVDFKNDWKFITIFIGGNDLCGGCLRPIISPECYIHAVDKAIRILHDECPRTFLNVVSVPAVNQIANCFGTLICDIMIGIICPCVLGGPIPQQFLYLKSREFQRLLRTSVESGKFDDKDDFTAVYQPFFENTVIPTLPDGRVDRSYVAPDCFHLSQKGQAAQATANWNNLFQPVGSKSRAWIPGEDLNCPSTDFPFLYTNVNSRAGFFKNLQNTSLHANKVGTR